MEVRWEPLSIENGTPLNKPQEVGEIISGKYKGAKLISDPVKPGERTNVPYVSPEYYLKYDGKKIYTFETGWQYGWCGATTTKPDSNILLDCSVRFKGLEAPSLITDAKGMRYQLAGGPIAPSVLGNASFEKISYDKDGRRILYDGTFYFLNLADGMLVAYEPDLASVVQNWTPKVAWSNGAAHIGTYSEFVAPDDKCINALKFATDLKVAGQASDGSPVYEPNPVAYKDAYACLYQEASTRGKYKTPDYAATRENFIKSHPVFIWRDGNGKSIFFASSVIFPPER